MKLKEFLKQFDGLDSELEVGLYDDGFYNQNIKVEIGYVNKPSSINLMTNCRKVIVICKKAR